MTPKAQSIPFTRADLDKINTLIIAGWAGRGRDAVEHHIQELEALGVPRPARTPTFYELSPEVATTADEVQLVGDTSSGEVEAVIIAINGDVFVTVGSDHTDRALETVGVALSKQVCAKPLAKAMWPLDSVADHWDSLIMRSWAVIDGEDRLYQEGPVSANLTPWDLADLLARDKGGEYQNFQQGSIMFCGTLPVIGELKPATAFTVELNDPILGRSIRHHYDCRFLPVAG